MTYLLLQTFLLLLSSYFFGAFLACLVKRTLMAQRTRGRELPGPRGRFCQTPVGGRLRRHAANCR